MPYTLKLYTLEHIPSEQIEIAQLQKLFEEELEGRYALEIINLSSGQKLQTGDRIHAIDELRQFLPKDARDYMRSLQKNNTSLVGMNIVFSI